MKKTIVAVAVLGAFAGSAMAADVSLYGRIDSGLVYQSAEDFDGAEVNNASMESGFVTGSRWGIKGTEDLGNFKVGFTLESGFTHDDGKSAQGSRLFGREAVVTVDGDFGKVYMGRIGSIVSDSGSMSLLGDASAFGNAYGYASMKYTTGAAMTRYDNVLGYVAPKFAGVQLSAQYAMGDNDKENKANTNRYAAFGAKYAAGPLTVVATADYTIYGHDVGVDVDNGYNIVIGGNYQMDVATVYGKVGYFDNMQGVASIEIGEWAAIDEDTVLKGYGLEFGVKVPALGGNVLASVGYRDAENVADSEDSYKLLSVNAGYNYAFSKRTSVYGTVGYIQEDSDALNEKATAYQAAVGLIHKF